MWSPSVLPSVTTFQNLVKPVYGQAEWIIDGSCLVDPHGRPHIMAGSDHYFHTCCPSVPTFQNIERQINFQVVIVVIISGRIMGLAKGIIDYLILLQGGDYKLTLDNYKFCWANFLLGRSIYGPGKYIFGVFDNSDIDTKYVVRYEDEE